VSINQTVTLSCTFTGIAEKPDIEVWKEFYKLEKKLNGKNFRLATYLL